MVGISSGVDLTQLREEVNASTGLMGYDDVPDATAEAVVAKWAETTGGTGAISIGQSGSRSIVTGSTSGSIGAIESSVALAVQAQAIGSASTALYNKFTIMWQCEIDDKDRFDNATFLMGLAQSSGSTRATNAVMGFILNGDSLFCLTDKAGTETTTDLSAYDTTTEDPTMFKIEHTGTAVSFFINNVLVATHTANIAGMTYIRFYIKNDVASNAQLNISGLRAWFEKK